MAVVHKLRHPFFEIFYPSLSLVSHFTKYAYGVTSPFDRYPRGWRHLWMAPLLSIICTFYMKLGENFIRSQVPESTITLPLFFQLAQSSFWCQLQKWDFPRTLAMDEPLSVCIRKQITLCQMWLKIGQFCMGYPHKMCLWCIHGSWFPYQLESSRQMYNA